VIASGILRIVSQLIGALVMYWLMTAGIKSVMQNIHDPWNTPNHTRLSPMNPLRYFCKHPVAAYTRGPLGRWAIWCQDCGREVKR